MDQVVKLIQERTGIDEAQARTAAETVVSFLKDRLPAPVAAQVDGVISGGGQGGPLGGLGNLGNLTGGG
jgi:hypothetical protein